MLYKPPKTKTATSLRQEAMNKVVSSIVHSGSFPQSRNIPPALQQQIGKRAIKEARRWRKRSVKQQKLYNDYTQDITDYFERKRVYHAPIYILTFFSKLVRTSLENNTIDRFYNSNRKFQKVGEFDPIEYEPGTGKYTFYFVKYDDDVFLSVYDFDKELVFTLCLDVYI